MEQAIALLSGGLHCETIEAKTHLAVVVGGWNDNRATKRALAQYLVGLRASAIDAACNIRAGLEDTPEDRIDLVQSVIQIVGETNSDLTETQKRDERNPWLAEGIWHLCLVIASRRTELHPVGAVVAVDYAHVAAKDHGLDVAAIYEVDDLFGLSLIESKAYRNDPSGAISRAVAFFREVDRGEHSVRIRQAVQLMRTALPPDQQSRISPSFWKRKRCYVPNPHYDQSCDVDWGNSRPSFVELKADCVLVMPHAITAFDNFFDEIADEMRSFARSL